LIDEKHTFDEEEVPTMDEMTLFRCITHQSNFDRKEQRKIIATETRNRSAIDWHHRKSNVFVAD
jgi:hypothetical protein